MSFVNNFKFIKTIDAIKKNNFRAPILKKLKSPFHEEHLRVQPVEHDYIYVNKILDFLIENIKEKENHIKELDAFILQISKEKFNVYNYS